MEWKQVVKRTDGGYQKISLDSKDFLLIEIFMRDNHIPIGQNYANILGHFLDFYKKQKKIK